MLKKMIVVVLSWWLMAGHALAAVEVNTADQAALDSIAGVGPSTSRAIIAEREKNGNFKDWSDLAQRVKGLGERNIVKLSAAGLVVNGKPHAPVAKATPAKDSAGTVMKAGATKPAVVPVAAPPKE